jgi:hypothetical protein
MFGRTLCERETTPCIAIDTDAAGVHEPAHSALGGKRDQIGGRLYVHGVEGSWVRSHLEVQAGQVEDRIHPFEERRHGGRIADIHLVRLYLVAG